MTVEINVYSGLEVHCVRPCYKQNDFVTGFSLHSINKRIVLFATETKAKLGITMGIRTYIGINRTSSALSTRTAMFLQRKARLTMEGRILTRQLLVWQ